ncbi:MAG: hypothetical protein GYA14_11410, partial [Ignavibacteria bacterium]|nr:hypothetical protein [Ignavibacteria bacterium]
MKPLLVIIFSIVIYNISAQPLAPSNLSASTTQVGLINLTWTDNSNNENGFLIEREFMGGGQRWLAFTVANTTNYQDYDILPNVIYTYMIRSYNVNGYSDYSNTISITSLANNPSNIVIWNQLNSGINDNINSIQFVNTLIGYAATDNSKILKTIDGGANWTVNQLLIDNKQYNFYNCFFLESNTGWLAGYRLGDPSSVLIKTTDGGNTWEKQVGPFQIGGIRPKDLKFLNYNTGWYLENYGGIYKTTNGGNSWTRFVIGDNSTNFWPEAIYFINEMTGWTVGNNGIIMFTSDGCKTWKFQHVDVGLTLRDVAFINNVTGFAVGDFGKLFKTTNGGDTWIQQPINALNDLLKIEFSDASNGYILAKDGRIFKTVDSGITWKPLVRFTQKYLLDIDFINADVGYVCGVNGLIYKTSIGGTIPLNAPTNLSAVYQNQNSVVL